MKEQITYEVKWNITKFKDEKGIIANLLKQGIKVNLAKNLFKNEYIEEDSIDDNIILNEGLYELASLMIGEGTPYDSTNAYIGIGDGTDAEDVNQTALTGANKAFLPMDAGYPSIDGATITWRSTAGADDANFAWNEFSLCNSNDDLTGINFNRKVSPKGIKNEGETWSTTLQVTLKNKTN